MAGTAAAPNIAELGVWHFAGFAANDLQQRFRQLADTDTGAYLEMLKMKAGRSKAEC